MARPSAADVQAARRVLAQVRASDVDAEEQAAATGRAYAAVLQAFAPVIGAAGFRAVFARSVKLSVAEFSSLAELQGKAEPSASDGQLARRLVACLSKLEPGVASAAVTELFARLIGLLNTFIGEQLVWQIMRSAFPAIDETQPKDIE